MRARVQKPAIVQVDPNEGCSGWTRNVAVAKYAPNIDNAKASASFIRARENAAMITNHTRLSNGSRGSAAFIDPTLAAAPDINPPEYALATEFTPTCPPATALIDKVPSKPVNQGD